MRMHAIGLAVALTVACTSSMGYQAETPAVKTVTPASPQASVSSGDGLIARGKSLELNTPYVPPLGDPLVHHTSGYAKIMCSAVFITGLDPDGFSRFSEVRVGYKLGYLDAKLRLGTPEFASVSGTASNARLKFLTDHTDDPVIPRRGYRMETNFRFFDHYPTASETIPAMEARLGYFRPITRPASVFVIGGRGDDVRQS